MKAADPISPASVDARLRAAARRLAASSPTPAVDARALLAHCTGWSPADMVRAAREPLDETRAHRFDQLVARRAAGEPVAHITGTREFWSLPLAVTPDTLIPRADTEMLVEVVLARSAREAMHAVDAGTGCGAVALALAVERPQWHVSAIDVCPAALAVARGNVQRIGAGNVTLFRGSWLAALADASVDVVAANPPYVAEGDPHLGRGDVRHEPRLALTAGADGLDAIRTLVRDAGRVLRATGSLWVEHGADQGQAVRSVLASAGFAEIETVSDLGGHPRVSGGRLRRSPRSGSIPGPAQPDAAQRWRHAG